ncbi:MAG TPA: PKD domain-containing protein [Rubricoccaceae bacterium]|nr:PKD domain-containing protein [Rubricoccaceae bacterium]
MTQRLPSSLLLGCAALLFFATAAEAQVVRPFRTLFIQVRGGATAYGGELDGTGSAFGDPEDETGWLFSDLGFGVAGDLGYQFTDNLGLSLGFLYGQYANLDRDDYPNPITGVTGAINEGNTAYQVQALWRYNLFPRARISPYIMMGGAAVFGRDQLEDSGNPPPGFDAGEGMGWGPVIGGGFDFLIGRQLSLFLEGHSTFVFPDDAFDRVDPGANALPFGDDADFDNANLYGGGLRFYFRPPITEVDILEVDCTTSLEVGETGSFTAMVNEDATEPVSITWNWGDGTTSEGMTASHSYSAPGTYTVSVTATGPANTDTETCTVTVTRPPAPATLANCRVSPTRVGVGENVTVNATVSGASPVSVTVDFGDGTTANSLPATHSYSQTGTYTITITATNAEGSDTCTVTVTVGDTFCEEVTELNTVYFGYEMSSLTDEARARLDENIEVLRRCPDICVVINGYSDDTERDKLRLSQRRADEVRAYYIANGIDEDRLLARGLGEAPDANNKEDPGPGDRNARRAESIPMDCDRMESMRGN